MYVDLDVEMMTVCLNVCVTPQFPVTVLWISRNRKGRNTFLFILQPIETLTQLQLKYWSLYQNTVTSWIFTLKMCWLDIRFVECLSYASTDTPQQQEPGADPGKIEPVTTHKMASYLMDVNIIFLENMCLTDLNHYKHSKMTIFWVRFNTGKNRNCI